MDTTRNPDTYVVTSVSHGGRPSGNIATMALRKTAGLKQNEYPQAASMIFDNTYVDYMINSVTDEANKLANKDEVNKWDEPNKMKQTRWSK